jgi:hypothetical protein
MEKLLPNYFLSAIVLGNETFEVFPNEWTPAHLLF